MMASVGEAFFEHLIRFAPDALIVVRDGHIVLANDRAQELFGYRQEEMLDRGLEVLFPGRCRGSFAAHLADPASALKGEALDLIGLRKDGGEFPAAATLRQVEAGGEPFLVFAIRGSTRCSQNEAGLKARVHQQALVAAQVLRTQSPVVVEDLRTDGRFPDAALLCQYGVVSSLNIPLFGHERPFGVLGAHTTRRRRFTDEDIHFVQSVANILSAAIERKWLEQRQHEQHLHRAEQMMAIGQVAAGVAHELRNPLTSIKGLVQVNLREARAHGLPEEDLAVIEHEIRRMERALQTFLDFARPPKPERRRLNPAAVVGRVYAVVAGRAKKGVSLRLAKPKAPVWLDADEDQLQQLLLNLILNSLDAMPQGGRVEVELRPPRDGIVELQVRDTGPGIPADILPKVFETFVSSKETGVGLGVPVSKRIAEDHGGSLSAYNLPEGGACFVLRLPAPSPNNS